MDAVRELVESATVLAAEVERVVVDDDTEPVATDTVVATDAALALAVEEATVVLAET